MSETHPAGFEPATFGSVDRQPTPTADKNAERDCKDAGASTNDASAERSAVSPECDQDVPVIQQCPSCDGLHDVIEQREAKIARALKAAKANDNTADRLWNTIKELER